MASAAKLVAQKDLETMDALLATMETQCKDGDFAGYSKNNLAFHEVIYNASGKPIAVEMIRQIKNQLRRFQLRTIMVPHRSESSLREHTAILSALKAHDENLAVQAIEAHLKNVEASIVKYQNLYM